MISIRSFSLISCLFFCSFCNAENNINTDILSSISKDILKATEAYGTQIEHCDKISRQSPTPKFNSAKLSSLGITREDAVIAIAYLKFNNTFLCEKKTKLELAYYLGVMNHARRELNMNTDPTEKLQSTLSYPSINEIKLKIQYLNLSYEKQSYFESIIGKLPFNLIKTLEKNDLMRN